MHRFGLVAVVTGITLPVVCVIVSMSISGVSYRIGNVCVPNHPSALVTWFGWLLALAIINCVVQIGVMAYSLWVCIQSRHVPEAALHGSTQMLANYDGTRTARQKVRSALSLHWRAVATALVTVNLTVYFGIVFIQQSAIFPLSAMREGSTGETTAWFECLGRSSDDRLECWKRPTGLGLSETRATGALILAAVRHECRISFKTFAKAR